MLVYADAKHRADPRALLRALIDHAAKLPSVAEPERHEALTSLLLDAGELAQGLIDAEQQRAGLDELTLLTEAATAMVRAVAEAFVADGWVDALQLRALARLALPEQVSISRPEGFAFYATYPCAWARAARRFVKRETRVIGIRSIGLTLAAVVAAAARARQLVSVRPIGHPFARELAIGPALAQRLLEQGSEPTYLIVDEGPGLSGSSFASVAQWLREHGVAADRIVLMPSHAGEPGPHASEPVRRLWATVRRQVPVQPSFEQFNAAEELSGGQWRRELYGAHPWPPANPQQERRKLLLRAEQRIAKFAGLGRYGADKLALARTLAAKRWVAEPLALAHGFLISEWIADALPLDHPNATFDRAALLRHIGDYIGFRADALPADPQAGASVPALYQMLLTNSEQALGPEASDSFSAWQPALAQINTNLRPCKTDNRMHRWEWLVTAEGTFIKCDALDHHATHDLIGAQDPLWDLVGVRPPRVGAR